MAERLLAKDSPFAPHFDEGDWQGVKTWAQTISDALSDVAGTGQNTRGFGTFIINRKWPRASTQRNGIQTKEQMLISYGILTVNTDETTTSGVIYVGLAAVGTATSAASWKMFEFYDLTHAEDPYKMRLCDGDELFDNIWDNRASVTYKEVRIDDTNEIVSTED